MTRFIAFLLFFIFGLIPQSFAAFMVAVPIDLASAADESKAIINESQQLVKPQVGSLDAATSEVDSTHPLAETSAFYWMIAIFVAWMIPLVPMLVAKRRTVRVAKRSRHDINLLDPPTRVP